MVTAASVTAQAPSCDSSRQAGRPGQLRHPGVAGGWLARRSVPPGCPAQPGHRQGPDLLGADAEEPVSGGERELGVAEQHRVPAQLVGPARHGRQPVQPFPFQQGLGTVQLGGGRCLGTEPGQFLIDRRLDLR